MPLGLHIISAMPASKMEKGGESECDTYWPGGICAACIAVKLKECLRLLKKNNKNI